MFDNQVSLPVYADYHRRVTFKSLNINLCFKSVNVQLPYFVTVSIVIMKLVPCIVMLYYCVYSKYVLFSVLCIQFTSLC